MQRSAPAGTLVSPKEVSGMNRRCAIVGIVVILSIVLLIGCGGGGEEAVGNTGGMQISVTFPPLEDGVQPAVIYGATNSITVDVVDPETGNPVVPRTVINRPAPQGGQVTVTISDIPAGNWFMIIAGWEEEDGAGKMVSEAAETVEITTGQTTEKSVVMDGWPYTLVVTANPNPILVDQWADILVTPKDVEGNTLLRQFVYSFESSNLDVCTVEGSVLPTGERAGLLQAEPQATANGIARGQATITVTLEGEAMPTSADVDTAQDAVTGTVVIVVDPNVDEVVVEPSTCTLDIDETIGLTATAKYQGNVVEDIDFSFTSADSNIASVTKTGQNTAEITGVSGGQCGVAAKQPYTSASATCAVTVPYGSANVVISETD